MASVCKVGMGYCEPQKKTGYGAKVGACAGLAAGLARVYVKRGLLNQMNDVFIAAGHSLRSARAAQIVGVGVAIAILTGVGALVGKGVEKVINHFSKNKPKGVMPGKNPKQPIYNEKDETFEKYRKAPMVMRTINSSEGDEYVIKDGHPKVVYKKDKETGDLVYQSAVYDGSWGKEMPDEDIVNNIKKTAEWQKLKKDGYTTFIGSDGKVSYIKQ